MRTSIRRTTTRMAVLGAAAACCVSVLAGTPAFAQTEEPRAVSCPTNGTLTQDYGGNHDGLDIGNAHGTPIYAADDGTVEEAGPASGYGNWIRIKHGDGSVTEYGHMQALHVAVGDQVVGGHHIADMGSEGESTGPHLHWEVHLDGGFNYGDNPHDWLAARGITGCW